MIDTRKNAVLLTIGILLLTCCCCWVVPRTYTTLRMHGVKQAASRIGVEPTTSALADYIREAIEIGMSRLEVEQVLSTIAPVKVVSRGYPSNLGSLNGPTACDKLWLMLTPLPGHEWRIRACYDGQDRLIYMESDESDGPALDIWAP